MNKQVHQALLSETLFAKSQVYITRGLRAKNQNDFEEYQLWSSLALELLAKSSLSSIHPALVADPTHYQSLFAACGRTLSADVKTITAKTLFERLSHISQKFDKRTQKFCEQLALRRNSEIHSGESPFAGTSPDSWENKFWHATHVILEIQNLELDIWLGSTGAQAPSQLLKDARSAIEMVVQTKISHAREDFEKSHKNKAKREQIIKESKSPISGGHYDKFTFSIDEYQLTDCPACTGSGFIGGTLWDEQVSQEYDQEDPFTEYIELTYSSEEFLCPVCNLHLVGTQEVSATNLPEEFYETDEREREFEPDYGND